MNIFFFIYYIISLALLSDSYKFIKFTNYALFKTRYSSTLGDEDQINNIKVYSIENNDESFGYYASVQLVKRLASTEDRRRFIENLVVDNKKGMRL